MTARITLYTRTGCHLCDEARLVIERVCAELDEEYYLHYAGLKPEFELRPIYERHAELTDLETIRRIGPWSGGSVRMRWRTPGACGPPASRARPSEIRVPRREEKTSVSWPTRRTSSYRETAQSWPSSDQNTGASARNRA